MPFAAAPLFAAVVPSVAAVAEPAISGNEAITHSVKVLPGVLCPSATSTNSATCSCSSLRPRERRCFAASSEISSACATRSTHWPSR